LAGTYFELLGINTAPEIICCWKEQIALLCGEAVDDDVAVPFSIEARHHQAILSWMGLLQERFSLQWQRVQDCHECSRRQETASHRWTGPWNT